MQPTDGDVGIGGGSSLRRALALRFTLTRGNGPLVIPVAGGAGALLRRRDCRRLASILDPGRVDLESSGIRSRLERRQARRSALLLVPDRATAMRLAARWHVDLACVHLAADLANPPRQLIDGICGPGSRRSTGAKPWYAR
jgi:hypothetical protein